MKLREENEDINRPQVCILRRSTHPHCFYIWNGKGVPWSKGSVLDQWVQATKRERDFNCFNYVEQELSIKLRLDSTLDECSH